MTTLADHRHAGAACEHLGGGECPRLALVLAQGDDLRRRLNAAVRIVARDNEIDLPAAQRLVNEELRSMESV
jgi:hypothetical protein